MTNKRRKTVWERLADDIWHNIFNLLNFHHLHRYLGSVSYRSLGSVSLVCKRFLALSNRLLTFIAIAPDVEPVPFQSLFSRFPNISSLRLGQDQHLDASITLLANSGLPLQSLHLFDQTHFPMDAMRLLGHRMGRTLKSLFCIRFKVINDDDLALVADCFPYLQQFDIVSRDGINYLTDRGILEISNKLNSLVSLNVLFRMHLNAHRSLQYLVCNCPSLLHLKFGFGGFDNYIDMDQLDRFDSFRSLSSLHLQRPKISRKVLVELSKLNLKLEKLCLDVPQITSDVTGEMLCGFFKSCRSLRHLQLSTFPFPTDTNAIQFAASVPNLQVIHLFSLFSPITPPDALLYLLKNCPLLKDISISCFFLGITQDWFNHTSAQCLVRTLDLFHCNDLCDETLKLLVSMCPKLESLSLLSCSKITQRGIDAVASSNSIKYLYAGACGNVPNFELDRRDHALEQ